MNFEEQKPKTLEELSAILPGFRFILFSELEEKEHKTKYGYFIFYINFIYQNLQYGSCFQSTRGSDYKGLSQSDFEEKMIKSVFVSIQELIAQINKKEHLDRMALDAICKF